ncbi:hypothetical protein ABG067_003840 [Albugo candida]
MCVPVRNTINGQEYTTGWRLSGMELKKWIDLKYLYTVGNFFFMTAQTYLTHNEGLYYLTWTEPEKYEINFGAHKVERNTGVNIYKGYFRTDIVSLVTDPENLKNQKIRIDIDVEAIQIPGAYFEHIKNKLSYMGVQLIKGEDKVRLVSPANEKREMSSEQERKLDFIIRLPEDEFIDLNPLHHTQAMFFEKSKDDTWVLVTS